MERPELSATGRRFAIATPHAEATAAGAAAFDAGGNAVDAALAAAATLAVVYPHMCGVGGDLFALIREPEGRTVVLNASGAAPAAVDLGDLRAQYGDAMPIHGPHAVTVPGAVSGWWQLAEHWSSLGFARAFEPAIAFAREGVPVARSLAAVLAAEGERLVSDPGIAEVFAPAGTPQAEGERLVQPALARTLEAIAENGPAILYGGEIGERLVHRLSGLGSPISLEDLASHEPELDSPLTGRFRDLDVSVAPPNSQGFVLLQILACLERLGLDPDPLGADADMLAHVFRVTARDRDRHNADPRVARVPVGTLVDEGHIAALCDAARDPAIHAGSEGPSDTAGLVAVDGDGLAISLIQSLYHGFGSGILDPPTGVVLQNRGAGFSLDPRHPNAIAGRKRPAHTLMPVVVQHEGRLTAVSGTMGGAAHPQINAMTLIRSLVLGLDAVDAVATPRWLVGGRRDAGEVVVAEARVSEAVRDRIRGAGIAVEALEQVSESVGHAHLIRLRPDGSLDAGADPRSDGAAAAR